MKHERISIDPEICSGKPCIRDTRIMVKNILGMIAGGYNSEKIIEAYPQLTTDDIADALSYASEVIDEDSVSCHSCVGRNPGSSLKTMDPRIREDDKIHSTSKC